MIAFSHAIVAYDLALLAVYALDFIAVSRRNDAVLARRPIVVILVLLCAGTITVANDKLEFALMGLFLLGAAAFAYANFLAFVKRGVTFSILSNHTRPPAERIPDAAFIAIDERLQEMRAHEDDLQAGQAQFRQNFTRAVLRTIVARQHLDRKPGLDGDDGVQQPLDGCPLVIDGDEHTQAGRQTHAYQYDSTRKS